VGIANDVQFWCVSGINGVVAQAQAAMRLKHMQTRCL